MPRAEFEAENLLPSKQISNGFLTGEMTTIHSAPGSPMLLHHCWAPSMTELFALVLSGLLTGSVYGLVGLGKVIIYKTTGTINFAIADIATLSMFLTLGLMQSGTPILICLFISMIVSGILSVAVDRGLLSRLKPGRDRLFTSLVLMIGVGFVIRAAIGAIWGHTPYLVPPLIEGTTSIGTFVVSLNSVASGIFALVAMTFVAWFFNATYFGVAMRAAADDPFAARLIGIKPVRIAILAWFFGGSLSALGIFFLASEIQLSPTFALIPLFRALAGVFLGGFYSMPGAVVGGLIIGVLDNLAGSYLSSSFRDTLVFGIIVAVLFIRPSGIFGKERVERV